MKEFTEEEVVIAKIKEVLPEFSEDRKVSIMREFIKAPGFDLRILYDMLKKELKNEKKPIASSSDDHHRGQENNSNSDGLKLKQKSTILRFKVSPTPLPAAANFSSPDSKKNNVINNQRPIIGNPMKIGDQQDKTEKSNAKPNRIVAATFSSDELDKNNVTNNQEPIIGNHLKVDPISSRTDLELYFPEDQHDKTKFDHGMPKTKRKVIATSSSPDPNNVIENKKPIAGNPLKIGSKRQRSDLDDYDDDNDDQEDKGRAKKKKSHVHHVPKTKVVASASVSGVAVMPADVPQKLEELMNRVKGCDPVLVIQKRLYKSDVNRDLGRLSLPLSQVNPRFLTEKEKQKLLRNDRIDVKIFEPCGEQCEITLTKWNMTSSKIYNLITTWNDVVMRNHLEVEMLVQLWSFRVGSQLCLLLIK